MRANGTAPRRAAEPSAAPRPPAVALGLPPALASSRAVRDLLDLRAACVEDVLAAVASRSVELVLLDGGLPAGDLSRVLAAAGPNGSPGRPAILVLADPGRHTNVENALIGHVDDFVGVSRGEGVLRARVQNALRIRAGLVELQRKNDELAALYAQLEGMARRMAEELRLAGNLQRSLLPPPLHHPRLDLAREFIPMREIGGDYLDLVPLGPGRLGFAIGDVMGKGVPAALLAANLKACLRAQLQAAEVPITEAVARVNRLFWEVTPKGLFATLFFAILDLERGELEYVNAGHDYPFLVRPDGRVEDLVTGGTVLGLVEASIYERGRVPLGRGDVLVAYSDGLTDRDDARGEPYGIGRLKEAALRSRQDAARIALYSILGEVQGFAEGRAPEDDMTLVVARVL